MHPAEPSSPASSFRAERLRWAWLLALPYLLLARPTPPLLLAGCVLSLPGLLLRALAAGSILKEERLAEGGLYARLRHPLYAGSFLIGLGFSVAGGRWWFPLVYSALFGWVYSLTVQAEEAHLERRFGERYRLYRRQVPAFLPKLRAYAPDHPSPGFRMTTYLRNKEWEAALGTVAGFLLLAVRMVLRG
jgi:hypothetical protein